MEVDSPVNDTADGIGIHQDTVDREFKDSLPTEKQPSSQTTLRTDITEEEHNEHSPAAKSLVKHININPATEIIDLTDYDDEDYYYDDDEDLDALDATNEVAVNFKQISFSAADQEEKKEEPEELVVKPTSSSKEENSKSGSEKEEPELLAVGKETNAKPFPVKPDADSIHKFDSNSEEDGSKPDEKPISNSSNTNSIRSPKKKKRKSKKKKESRPSEKRESRTTEKKESSMTEERESRPSPKKEQSRDPITSPQKQDSSDERLSDFKSRKLAKDKRSSELQMFLGGIGEILTVKQQSDDSVSILPSQGGSIHSPKKQESRPSPKKEVSRNSIASPKKQESKDSITSPKKQESRDSIISPKKQKSRDSITSPKKQDSGDKRQSDFKIRKQAKKKRASELQIFLGGIEDTLMVEQRSDDSISFLTIPKGFEDSDGEALQKSRPLDPHNPMLAMGGDEEESLPRLSYGLELLINPSDRARDEKWENISDTTEEVETVLGEDLDEEMGLMSVDLQPSDMEPPGKNSLETSVVENEGGGIVSKVKSISQKKTATLAASIISALKPCWLSCCGCCRTWCSMIVMWLQLWQRR